MPDEINIDGDDNIVIQNVGVGANIEVKQILAKSYEYNDLLDRLKTKQELFDLIPEENIEKRLRLSEEINELTETFEKFKRDVLALAETFNKIEINTDRLRRAKEFFDKGEIGEARAVLETELEQMQSEQKYLLKEREHYETDTLPKLINNSEEFYLLAMATQTDYDNPNRFADTCKYFETSIESYANKDNVLNFAVFLQKHNQFKEAEQNYSQFLNDFSSQISIPEFALTLNNLAVLHLDQNNYEEASKGYEEALKIYRQLAETEPDDYLPDVAMTLNNLGNLHSDQNNYEEASKNYEEALRINRQLAEANPNAYLPDIAMTLNNLAIFHASQNSYEEALKEYEEALQIRRQLAQTNPNAYLTDVAMSLNNLAVLHRNQNNYEAALKEHEEALQIRRQLAQANPNTYLPDVAMSLNNLALLHSNQNNYDEALNEYKEALKIRRQLAEIYPNAYLPDVAVTLNNLAVLHSDQNNYEEASKEYEEALQIYRQLAETNPNTYLPYVAMTLINLSIDFQDAKPQRTESIKYALEAAVILVPFIENVPFTQEYFSSALNVLRDWGLSDEEITQMIEERMKENQII